MSDFTAYRDKDGYTTDKPGREMKPAPQGGNGALFTALECYARFPHRIEHAHHRARLIRLYTSLEHPKAPGVIMRTPDNKFGQDSHDNAYAVAYLALRTGGGAFIERWLSHGPLYMMNNKKPGKWTTQAFMGRFLHLVACMRMAVGRKPNFLHRAAWLIAQWSALRSYGKNVEAATHFVIRNDIALRSNWPGLRRSARSFQRQFEEKGGLAPVLRKWGKHWQQHPITLSLEEE